MRYLNLIEPEKMPFEKSIARSLTGLILFKTHGSLPKQPFLTLKGDSELRGKYSRYLW
jgi:hypothetical protein